MPYLLMIASAQGLMKDISKPYLLMMAGSANEGQFINALSTADSKSTSANERYFKVLSILMMAGAQVLMKDIRSPIY